MVVEVVAAEGGEDLQDSFGGGRGAVAELGVERNPGQGGVGHADADLGRIRAATSSARNCQQNRASMRVGVPGDSRQDARVEGVVDSSRKARLGGVMLGPCGVTQG